MRVIDKACKKEKWKCINRALEFLSKNGSEITNDRWDLKN